MTVESTSATLEVKSLTAARFGRSKVETWGLPVFFPGHNSPGDLTKAQDLFRSSRKMKDKANQAGAELFSEALFPPLGGNTGSFS
jgi:hypothetical protein